MRRFLDFLFSLFGLLFGGPIMMILYVLCYCDTGSPILVQRRVGKDKKPFNVYKFRTMPVGTLSVASHLLNESSVTKLGALLRMTKLDELPQLINVLKGEMSLVGPRPNLFNQEELIAERDKLGVYRVLPGITGLGQIQKIDMSSPKLLAEIDKKMIDTLNLKNYFKYILTTLTGKACGDSVSDGE